MIWLRHLMLCTKFCAVSHWRSETRITACGGSIDALDLGEFEANASPPAELRCGACERALCDAGPINRGLRELVANSPEQSGVGERLAAVGCDRRADEPALVLDIAPADGSTEPALTTPAQWREAFDAIDRRFDRSCDETEIVDVDGFECGGEA